ncbi:MAG: Phospholipase D/competence protein ComEA helix-hairpin-helix domain protein [Candidatus Jorgensenbacteria bacterium GW2011_GWA2_45_9]|uniref:Phospholipase D/competence protein ComEA helix-hairpin-helix domain protein n=1 Tax=Candidatus Jorgensenbacteria bacterium GW2011_GWA2_45_9 TaxID=1618663 RepID=A0A0G1N2B9_9BACT|nr:MAG: Phospholipase D/competence protein ComEA helix-hairpin-helix domain protein [Candidatus Jorgensenbacteria bacterium GW2011_GWA2_45_9]
MEYERDIASKKKFKIRKTALAAGGVIILGASGVAAMQSGGSPSFFADVSKAFSNTFLKQEKLLGEIELAGNGDARGVDEPRLIKCAFDALGTPARSSVLINEVAWMGSVGDAKNEWIELKNRSKEIADVSFWKLLDRGGDISVVLPKGTEITAGGFLAIGKKADDGENISLGGSIKNSDERLRLFNSECVLEDEAGGEAWPAGDNKTKQTMERNVSGFGWHTSIVAGGTPRKENSGGVTVKPATQKPAAKTVLVPAANNTSPSTENNSTNALAETETVNDGSVTLTPISTAVRIQSVCAGTADNASFEFIRMYNPSDKQISLSGWFMKKVSSTGNESTLVSSARFESKILPAGGILLLAHEGGYSGTATPDILWPKSYSLAGKKNGVILYDGAKNKVGEVWWEEKPAGDGCD